MLLFQNRHEPLNCLRIMMREEQALSCIKSRKNIHIIFCKMEVEYINILPHSLCMHRFRNHNNIAIKKEAKSYLSWALIVLFSDLNKFRRTEESISPPSANGARDIICVLYFSIYFLAFFCCWKRCVST